MLKFIWMKFNFFQSENDKQVTYGGRNGSGYQFAKSGEPFRPVKNNMNHFVRRNGSLFFIIRRNGSAIFVGKREDNSFFYGEDGE